MSPATPTRPPGGRFVRRNRVDERLAAAIAVFAGVLAIAAPASPTGSTVPDAVVLAVAVAAVTWAAASAPWWAVAAAGAIAAATTLSILPAVLGILAFLAGLHVGAFRRDDSALRAIGGALAVEALLWSRLGGPFGTSAVVGVVTALALLIVSIRRRPSRIRRPAWRLAAVAGVVLLAGVIGAGVAATGSRSDVTASARGAREAVGLLNRGDYEGAAARFDDASAGFERGASSLGGPLTLPGRLVPGLAQNLTAGRVLSEVAADATAEAAAALREIDPSRLTLVDGRLDLDAVRGVQAPLERVQGALRELESGSARVDSPWLVAPIRRQLDRLEEEIADDAPLLQNAIDAVAVTPDLLGGDGARRYLVLLSSPAEARGAAGFVGNFAEVTADDGRLAVTRFGRIGELNAAIAEGGSSCDGCPEEFIAGYGRFGFTTGPDGGVGKVPWSNITMPSHFPYAAQVAASLYPDSGGEELDGVIAMDPYVLAQLMAYTGPIEVPELSTTVASADAADFLLLDQYSLAAEKEVRVEALDTLGREAITRLLTSSLPDPTELARDFGPLVEERRLLVWTDDPAERSFLVRIGMLGALPPLDPADGGFSVAVTNASANKIESFLEREVATEVVDGPDGARRLVADVTLTNGAPSSGYPEYVIGNPLGLPVGTSRLMVTFYGPPIDGGVELDGERIDVATFTESGWLGYRTTVELASGASASFHLEFDLPAPTGDPGAPATWAQALRRDVTDGG